MIMRICLHICMCVGVCVHTNSAFSMGSYSGRGPTCSNQLLGSQGHQNLPQVDHNLCVQTPVTYLHTTGLFPCRLPPSHHMLVTCSWYKTGTACLLQYGCTAFTKLNTMTNTSYSTMHFYTFSDGLHSKSTTTWSMCGAYDFTCVITTTVTLHGHAVGWFSCRRDSTSTAAPLAQRAHTLFLLSFTPWATPSCLELTQEWMWSQPPEWGLSALQAVNQPSLLDGIRPKLTLSATPVGHI